MRTYSLTQTVKTTLKSIFAGVLLVTFLASFTEDSSRPYIKIRTADTGKATNSSIGASKMSKSMTVTRSMYEVHQQFLANAEKNEFLIAAPTATEIATASEEVNRNFSISTMWKAQNSRMMAATSSDEVNTQFEKENTLNIAVRPNAASIDEVNEQFEAQNKK